MDHRGSQGDIRDLVLLDMLDHLVFLEPSHDMDRAADINLAKHAPSSCSVVYWRDDQLLTGVDEVFSQRVFKATHFDVPVRPHAALWHAGCSGCQNQCEHVVVKDAHIRFDVALR